MTREECEKAIGKHLIAIRKLYNSYNPDGKQLSLSILKGECESEEGGWWTQWYLSANNSYFNGGEDQDKPINFFLVYDEKDDTYYDVFGGSEQDKELKNYYEKEGMILCGEYLYHSIGGKKDAEDRDAQE